MKRSQINKIIKKSIEFAESMNYKLPPFAFWTLEEWEEKNHEYDEIRENMLGWDITDWGRDNFEEWGLVLFTLRNGNLKDPKNNKAYAEKLLIIDDGQKEPYHYHWQKVEDIINRGGGTLVIKLYQAGEDNELSDEPVNVCIDGHNFVAPAGYEAKLEPGESLTIQVNQYHSMYTIGEKVLASEISNVNDDKNDNCFLEEGNRFPKIEEDEEPLYLLCNEYPKSK